MQLQALLGCKSNRVLRFFNNQTYSYSNYRIIQINFLILQDFLNFLSSVEFQN